MLSTISGKLGDITRAGAEVLANFLKGIANNIRTVVSAAVDVMLSFIQGIADNIGKVVNTVGNVMVAFINAIANYAGRIISAGAAAIAHLISGIGSKAGDLVDAAAESASKFVRSIASGFDKLVNAGADAIISMVRSMRVAINSHSDELNREAYALGGAIINGIISGIAASAGGVVNALVGAAGRGLQAVKNKLHIKSPSRVFMEIGNQIMEGMAVGISEGSDNVSAVLVQSVDAMVNTMVTSLSAVPAAIQDAMDMNPVIAPILDLTNIQQGAATMSSLLNVVPITAAASYGQASVISAGQNTVQSDLDNIVAPGSTQLVFNQITNSRAISQAGLQNDEESAVASKNRASTSVIQSGLSYPGKGPRPSWGSSNERPTGWYI